MKRAVWRNFTMQAAEALRAAAVRLSDKSDTPRLDAELLLAHALGIERQELLLTLRDVVVPSEFAQLVGRRVDGEPVAYLVGTRDFWNITITVTSAVLIPCQIVSTSGRERVCKIVYISVGAGCIKNNKKK